MIKMKSREAIVQNLKNAGCGREMINSFLIYFDKDRKEKQLELLSSQRKELLNRVHKEEKRISCLDYLIHQIESDIA
ncbi:MAG: hypothetical protein KH355_12425 [Clostridiales bacterium]|nr:hypothetical protein [Clostridiales bacterium]